MGFKKTTRNLDFADLAMATGLEQNRSIKLTRANRARFTTIIKNQFDAWFRQAAFNVARGMKILSRVAV